MNKIAVQNKTVTARLGFTSYSLKVLALLLMTLDHIYYYLGGGILPVPHVFTLLGRISAPLFLFAMAEGFSHTHDRTAYLKRLYIASVLMSVGNSLINVFLPHPGGAMVINGMFAALFLVGLYIWAIELLIVFYVLISGFFFFSAASAGLTYENLFILNDQWFMILSLPFILLYNGQRGRKMKYFFYVYYPLHVYLLVILARIVA